MNWKLFKFLFRNLPTLILLIVFIVGGFIAYTYSRRLLLEQRKQELELEARFKELEKGIAQSKTEYISRKELISILKENNKTILDEIKKKKEKPLTVGHTTGTVEMNVERLVPSDHSFFKYEGYPGNHEYKKIYLLDGDTSLFIAWAMFHPNQDPEHYWRVGTVPFNVHSTIVESINKSGRKNYYTELYLEGTKAESKGLKFPLDVTSSDFKTIYPDKKEFFWWSPHIDLGGSYAFPDRFAFDLGFSIASYGLTKSDNDWRFLRLHAGGAKDFIYLGLDPIGYNAAKLLPIVDDIYIYPGIISTLDGIGFSISFASSL